MRPSWIVQVGSDSNDKCLRRKRRPHRRAEGHVMAEAKLAVMQPQAKGRPASSAAGRGGEEFFPGDCRRSTAPPTP